MNDTSLDRARAGERRSRPLAVFLKKYHVTLLALVCGLVLGPQAATGSADGHEHPAEVRVWQKNFPDKVVYYYRVINQATGVSIAKVVIGYDYYRGMPTLTARPQAIRSPSGWTGQIISTEETLNVEVEWRRDENASNSVRPGAEKRGFALELPTANSSYRSFYTLIFGDGTVASGQVLPDSEPPPNSAALAAQGVTVAEFALAQPSLDDVFFALTGHAAEERKSEEAA